MELLIIKSEDNYIRVKDKDYLICKMDKASVFPLEKIDLVKKHVQKLTEKGFACVSIFKLVILESPYELKAVADEDSACRAEKPADIK
jgi:hypothetical protein